MIFPKDFLASSPLSPMQFGYADIHCNVVIPKQFSNASNFTDGVALVQLGEQKGFIDHTGKFVLKLPKEYIEAGELSDGLAAVAVRDAHGIPKWGFH